MLTFPIGLTSHLSAPPASPAMWVMGEVGLYDATSGGSVVTADEALIARWEDQSGNARHLTQGTSGSRPKYDAVKGHVVDPMPDLRYFDSAASFTVDRRDFSVFFLQEQEMKKYVFLYNQ